MARGGAAQAIPAEVGRASCREILRAASLAHQLRHVRVVDLAGGAAQSYGGLHPSQNVKHRGGQAASAHAVFLIIHGVTLRAHLLEFTQKPMERRYGLGRFFKPFSRTVRAASAASPYLN